MRREEKGLTRKSYTQTRTGDKIEIGNDCTCVGSKITLAESFKIIRDVSYVFY